MQERNESRHKITSRFDRQFDIAMGHRFSLHALWIFWEWGLLTEEVAIAIEQAPLARVTRAASRGEPSSSGASRTAVKKTRAAASARRTAKKMQNREARLEAARQAAGYCENCNQWRWWYKRTKCHYCFIHLGECCQAQMLPQTPGTCSAVAAFSGSARWLRWCGVCRMA